jgi:hypothetical protein
MEPKSPQVRHIPVKIADELRWSLNGCLMTHMDEQIAKHIKEMVARVARKANGNPEPPTRSDTLIQVVQALRSRPDYPYDLMHLAYSTWDDEGLKT